MPPLPPRFRSFVERTDWDLRLSRWDERTGKRWALALVLACAAWFLPACCAALVGR